MTDEKEYERWGLAQYVIERLKLTNREHRVLVTRAIVYGNM